MVTPFDFRSYPWSHSLLMSALWAAGFGLLVWWRARSVAHAGSATRPLRAGLVVAGLVLSHWCAHRADLPLLPGSDLKVGLGLWNSRWGTAVVELSLLLVGLGLYLGACRPRRRRGTWGLVALVVVLLAVGATQLTVPSPPATTPAAAIAGPGLALWLLVLWAWWIDRNRQAAGAPVATG